MYFRHKFTGCARRSFGHSPLLHVVFGLRWQRSLHFPLCPEVGSSPQFHPSFILSSTCLQHEAILLNNTPPFIPSLFLASLRSRFRLFNYAVPTCHLEQHPPWAAACGPPCQSKLPQEQVCVDRRCKPEKQSSQYVWCVCISVVECFSSINKDSKWALGHWQLALKHATYNKFDYPLTYLGIKSNQKQNSVKVLELWTSCLSTVFLTNSRGSSAHVQNYNRASSRLKIDLTHHFRLLGRYPATEKKEMKAFYIWTWQFHVLKKKNIYIYKRPKKIKKISQAQFLQYI